MYKPRAITHAFSCLTNTDRRKNNKKTLRAYVYGISCGRKIKLFNEISTR